MQTATEKLFTLNVTPNWQPTDHATGQTADFRATLSRYVVDWGNVTLRGNWLDEEKATAFANSCWGSRDVPTVREVPAYWYVHGFGRVG